MVQVSLTVGKLDASVALLLTKDHHLIEFPTILLPDGITTGSIVKLDCERDLVNEEKEREEFMKLQEQIFEIFGKYEPKNPVLKIVNVTQTSCVLEWENLDLGTSELKELSLYKNGSKLTPIKNPFTKKNIKFSGLPIDTLYKFQLKLETTSGNYFSNLIEFKTHKMTDLSGITICIGDIDYSKEKFSKDDIENLITTIGAKPLTNEVKIDTTQFICTEKTGLEYQKAKNMNIPIIRPEWLKACQLERRIVGVNKFYLDAESPIWKTKDFWIDSEANNKIPPEIIVSKEDLSVVEESKEPVAESSDKHEEADEGESKKEAAETNDREAEKEEDVAKDEAKEDVTEEAKQEPIEEPAIEVIEEPTREPVAEAIEEPVAESVEEATQESTTEAIEEPSGEHVEESAAEVAEVVEEPVAEVVEEPVAEPVAEQTAEAAEATEEPAGEPVVEATEEPIEESVAEPAAEPAAEAIEEPAEEPVAETIEEPVTEAIEEPVTEANEEPAAETREPLEELKEETAEEAPESETVAEEAGEEVETEETSNTKSSNKNNKKKKKKGKKH